MGDAGWVEKFKSAWKKNRDGLITEAEFAPLRSLVGFHRSRDGSYHLRLRFPGGRLTPSQAAGVSSFLQQWCTDPKAFLTPRQCLQVYGLDFDDLPEVLDSLPKYGLSSLRSGGGTVRNLSLCEGGGVCPLQASDPLPVLEAIEEGLRNGDARFPTRTKLAVSACGRDCAGASTHAVGLVGTLGPDGRPGFILKVGGGLGRHPRLADVLVPFIPYKEAPAFVARCLEAYRHLVRDEETPCLKSLLEAIGPGNFLKAMERQAAPAGVKDPEETPGSGPLAGGQWPESWKEGVGPHREEGFHTFKVRVPGGWLHSDQFALLAHLAQRSGGGELRITQDQNMLLTRVEGVKLAHLLELLVPAGLGEAGAGTPEDPTACPGPKYCRGAVGYDVTEAVRHWMATEGGRFRARGWSGTVRISNCGHQCARTGSAALGLSVEAHTDLAGTPTVKVFMGGGRFEEGWRLAREVGEVDARWAPESVREVFRRFQEDGEKGESFESFCHRMSLGERPLAASWFVDWSPARTHGTVRV